MGRAKRTPRTPESAVVREQRARKHERTGRVKRTPRTPEAEERAANPRPRRAAKRTPRHVPPRPRVVRATVAVKRPAPPREPKPARPFVLRLRRDRNGTG